MIEFQQLTNSFAYTMNLKKEGYNLQKQNRLYGLITCYHLLRHGVKQAYEDLKYWGIESTTVEQLELKILQERTKLNINYIQKHEKEELNNKEPETFEKLVVAVEMALNREINIDNYTVSKWVYLLKKIEERARELEKQNNARQNNIARHTKL